MKSITTKICGGLGMLGSHPLAFLLPSLLDNRTTQFISRTQFRVHDYLFLAGMLDDLDDSVKLATTSGPTASTSTHMWTWT